MSEATQKITQDDIDAAWQFMLAAAPQLVTRPLEIDGRILACLAQIAVQARLELVALLGKDYLLGQLQGREE